MRDLTLAGRGRPRAGAAVCGVCSNRGDNSTFTGANMGWTQIAELVRRLSFYQEVLVSIPVRGILF